MNHIALYYNKPLHYTISSKKFPSNFIYISSIFLKSVYSKYDSCINIINIPLISSILI
jgi:hypothetical protein